MSFKCLLYVCVLLFQAVLNQKFTDCFVLVFLDTQAGKTVSRYSSMAIIINIIIHHHYKAPVDRKCQTFFFLKFFQSLKIVFREPLPSQPQASSSPPPQLVSMYHHLESVINTACYNLWTGLL